MPNRDGLSHSRSRLATREDHFLEPRLEGAGSAEAALGQFHFSSLRIKVTGLQVI